MTGSMSYSRNFRIAAPAATGISGTASRPGSGLPNVASPATSNTIAVTTANTSHRNWRTSSPRARRIRATSATVHSTWKTR